MPDFGTYLGWNPSGDLEEWYRQSERADSVAFMIGHRGVSLAIVRGDETLDAQSVILAPAGRDTTASERKSESGSGAYEQLLIVGQPDLDIKRGDLFKYPSTVARLNYKVVRVERTLHGMVQAYAEETQ